MTLILPDDDDESSGDGSQFCKHRAGIRALVTKTQRWYTIQHYQKRGLLAVGVWLGSLRGKRRRLRI